MNLPDRHSQSRLSETANIRRHHSGRSEESLHSSQRRRRSLINRLAEAFAGLCCVALFLIPVLTSPVHASSKQTREAGAETFKTKGCEHCHGIDAIGTDRGPELSDIGKRWKKDRIEKQIREGGGGMPPFGDALQPDEVKDLVDFLSAKRRPVGGQSKPAAEPNPASKDQD